MIRSSLVLAILTTASIAATFDAINTSRYLTNIGGTAAGSQGSITLDPPNVLAWANYNSNQFLPTFSGGSQSLTLSQVGTFTPSTITDNRFSDAHGATPTTDTIGIRGSNSAGMASGEGFQISFTPGSIGTFQLTIHTTDFGGTTNWTIASGSSSLSSGTLPNSTALDEGAVTFQFTTQSAEDAAATWSIQLTAGTTAHLTINSASLVKTTQTPPPPTTSTQLGKILCIGDSITEGNANRSAGDGNWSWRYWCWQNFVDFNVGHEFVGTRTANNGGSSSYPTYANQSFVNRHEAIWGTTFLERSNSTPTFLTTLKNNNQTPDIAVIFGGGNDIPLNLSVSADTVRARTKTIIDHLQGDLGSAGNPNIKIILVSILPRFAAPPSTTPDARNSRYEEINSLLSALASSETTSSSTVSYLPVSSLFTNPSDARLYDGVHPNGKGEQLIGNAIFAALVPNMDAVSLHVDSVNLQSQTIQFNVRTHGPKPVIIQTSPDLSPNSWSTYLPQTLNPGEWTPIIHTPPSSLPAKSYFRAIIP